MARAKSKKTQSSIKRPKGEKKSGPGPGRPRKTIPHTALEQLCSLQCTQREAAAFFGCSLQNFQANLQRDAKLAEIWERGKQKGLLSLRRYQFALAQRHAGMAIFLGKNYLDQKDQFTTDLTGKVDIHQRIHFTTDEAKV